MGNEFGGEMSETIGAETLPPVVELGPAVFERTMERKNAVPLHTIEQVGVSVMFVMGGEVKLTDFNTAFSFLRPIISFMLAFKVIAE